MATPPTFACERTLMMLMPYRTRTRLGWFSTVLWLCSASVSPAQPSVGPSQILTPPSGRGSGFGSAVAVSGTTLVIGEPDHDQKGLVHVYELYRGTWTPQAQVIGAEVLPGDRFGASVALDGDTLVVGAPGDDTVRAPSGAITATVENKGAAYVFRRSSGRWTQETRVDGSQGGPTTLPLTPEPGDAFGTAVAVAGTLVAVGAPLQDAPFYNVPDAGLVFVYQRDPAQWSCVATVSWTHTAAPAPDSRLGTTLAMTGEVIAAGGGGQADTYVGLIRRVPFTPERDDWHVTGIVPTWYDTPAIPQDGIGLLASFGTITTLVPTGAGLTVTETGTLRAVTADGVVTTSGPLPPAVTRVFESPTTFIAANENGQLFRGDLSGGFTFLAGNPTLGLVDGTGTTAGFGVIGGVAPDGQGNYYVADLAAIRRVMANGQVTTVAGLPGVVGDADGPAGVGQLGTARAIVFEPGANLLYIADRGAIRTMAPDGTLTTLAGLATTSGTSDGPGSQARFTTPRALALAPGGGVWLLDGNALRRVTAAGHVTTQVGEVASAPLGDPVDGSAAIARFTRPDVLAVAADGTRYVADLGLVRRVAADGTVSTIAGRLRQPQRVNTPGNSIAIDRTRVAVALPGGRAPLRPVDDRRGVIWTSALTATHASSPVAAFPPPDANQFGRGVAFSGDLLFASQTGGLQAAPVIALRQAGDRWQPVFSLVPGALAGNGTSWFGSALAATDRFVVVASAPGPSVASTGVVFVYDIDRVDTDGDGLPDRWETRYGLDPASTAGVDGADGDPDGDGLTNAAEYQGLTHPHDVASHTRYFAEGAVSGFFTTEFAIANPGPTAAEVLLRYADGDGTIASTPVTVPAQQRRTVRVPSTDVAQFATRVESNAPVVVDRLMSWDVESAYGSHGERAQEAPTTTWYFAEGATHSGFELFYLLYNPSPTTTASVRVRYLRGSGAPLEKVYDVPPGQRFNVWVNLETFDGQPLLAAAEVSARVTVDNGVPIIAERAMYRTPPSLAAGTPGALFAAGHESAGITAPASSWFFAEGATNDFFDLFVLIANPGEAPSTVRARFLLGDGRTFTKTYVVPGNSRFNIWVDQETFDGVAGTPLANVGEVSTTLDVLAGPTIVAERAMWWPGPTADTWVEAHDSAGATSTAARWVAAAGEVSAGVDTYYLLANPGDAPAAVTVTLLVEDGAAPLVKAYTVGARSRFTVHVRSEFPDAVGTRFSAVVSTAPDTPLIVEWSMYRDALGQIWGAGANALATPWP